MVSNSRIARRLLSVYLLASVGACSPSSETSGEHTTSTRQSLSSTTQTAYSPISLLTWPGADCVLHDAASTTDSSQGLPVLADDDGVAAFYGVPAPSNDSSAVLSLDCQDDQGRTGTYVVDLRLPSTFATLQKPAGAASSTNVRPSLAGDPLSYSQIALINAGYGLRPDPVRNPSAYAAWLKAASQPARKVQRKPMQANLSGNTNSAIWGGPVLLNFPTYGGTIEDMQVPVAGNNPGCAANAICGQGIMWGGVGGVGNDTLIQSGVVIQTYSNQVATYYAWNEYCCGVPNGARFMFFVRTTTNVEAEAWACDSAGNVSATGGYGCFFVQDTTDGQYQNCSVATDPTCPSLPAPTTFNGSTAEFVFERPNPGYQLSDYTTIAPIFDVAAYQVDTNTWHDFGDDLINSYELVGSTGTQLESWQINSSTEVDFQFEAGQ